MQEIIPADFIRPLKQEEFLTWLRRQRVDAEDKKQLLRLWADRVHMPITGDMILRAGIERR